MLSSMKDIAFQAHKLTGSSSTLDFVAIASSCQSILKNATTIFETTDAETMQK